MKKNDGERCPSYTDRILFHSLSDTRPNLTLLAYEMNDTITVSLGLGLGLGLGGFRVTLGEGYHMVAPVE